MFVTVKDNGLAVHSDVITGGQKLIKCIIRLNKLKVHELTGRIIYIDKQGAFTGAPFKPIMVCTIHLN